MQPENEHLRSLLTELFSAVSQQFFHILLLRRTGETELTPRFVEVDDEDFKNTMAIVDLLVERRASILINPHSISPGFDVRDILSAELAMERHLQVVFEQIHVESKAAKALVDRATKMRADYRAWLERELAARPSIRHQAAPETDAALLLAQLLQLMEQAMVHAFQYWHAGKNNDADTAWQTSGAAMIYLTALAPFAGSHFEDSRKTVIRHTGEISISDGFARDMALVEDCDVMATRAANEAHDQSLANLCRRISADCQRLATTTRGSPINAKFGYSDTFSSFVRARETMMRI
ncbi:hypothetical protein [Ruegeria sp.]|uniref:hypothetical protein n=1 Tax=Ruegeria sp. TaxID=1879320 RepID=UPI00230EE3F1|nr:hypothetical protein [Ruegeria sp.]MDA7966983.1 hypothetical protein [Ruegeria sp.]